MRFRPKQFAPPRSRAARDALWPPPEKSTLDSTARILRRYWPCNPGAPIYDRPAWAKVSLKFGWLTQRGFWEVPEIVVGTFKGLDERIYEASPMFGLLRKAGA